MYTQNTGGSVPSWVQDRHAGRQILMRVVETVCQRLTPSCKSFLFFSFLQTWLPAQSIATDVHGLKKCQLCNAAWQACHHTIAYLELPEL